MKHLVINQAEKDYNESIATVNTEIIKSNPIDTNRTYFYFQKKPSIEIGNYSENIYYTLGLHSINFQYWDLDNKGNFERYSNNDQIGALAAYEGFNNLYEKFILTGSKSESLMHQDISAFFGKIPSTQMRLFILKESLNKNLSKLAQDVIMSDAFNNNLIDTETARKVSEIMPISFSDPYLKKIQLALFEISELLKIKHPRLKTDLTVAADYQIPKVLEALGFISYSAELKETIKNNKEIKVDSTEELAIRAASILACEQICLVNNVSTEYVDKILWENRNTFGDLKFHLTSTTRY